MKHKKYKVAVIQIVRHIIQLIAFILFPGLFIITYSAIKNTVVTLISGSFTFAANGSDLILAAAILIITILAGRFFCGFLCSFGFLEDILYLLSGLVFRRKRPVIGKKADRILKYVKYLILVLLIVFVWLLGNSLGSSNDPWYVFGVYSRISGYSSIAPLLSIGGGLLIIIIVLSFFFERFFCRYLCPLGAIFTLLSRFRLFRIRKDNDTCVKCGKCDRQCSMGISIAHEEDIRSGECINCMHCTDCCPKGSLKTNINSIAAGTAAAVVIAGVYTLCNILPVSTPVVSQQASDVRVPAEAENPETVNSPVVAEDTDITTDISAAEPDAAVSGKKYADGTYRGSAIGYRGTIVVDVTVENDEITDITVVSQGDDGSFFRKAEAAVIPDIIESQSTDVSAVSGATFSSEGIMDAVADALSAASITDDIIPDAADADTEPAEAEASEPEPAEIETSVTEAAENETSVTEAFETETIDAINDVLGGFDLADGVYSGTGTGFRGEITVDVTIKDNKITDITVTSGRDDARFFNSAKSGVIPEIIDSQTTDVSAVSGATFSSNGIIEAVSNALGIEFENPNNSSSGQSHGGHGGPGGSGGSDGSGGPGESDGQKSR
ncbi:MAG: FMN-binding protein [Parasporobacterium sp.]|nr:FMN-binding protein [Parasporobacterium sp.]